MSTSEPAKLVHRLTGVEVSFQHVDYLESDRPVIEQTGPLAFRVSLQNTEPTKETRYLEQPIVSIRNPGDPYDNHLMIGRPRIALRRELKDYVCSVYACRLAARATGRAEGELRHEVLTACSLLRPHVEHSTARRFANPPRGSFPVDPRVVAIAKKLL